MVTSQISNEINSCIWEWTKVLWFYIGLHCALLRRALGPKLWFWSLGVDFGYSIILISEHMFMSDLIEKNVLSLFWVLSIGLTP